MRPHDFTIVTYKFLPRTHVHGEMIFQYGLQVRDRGHVGSKILRLKCLKISFRVPFRN